MSEIGSSCLTKLLKDSETLSIIHKILILPLFSACDIAKGLPQVEML